MMQPFLYGLAMAGISFVGTNVQAVEVKELPILVKESTSGPFLKEMRKIERCEIYRNKTVIVRTFGELGSLTAIETKDQKLQGDYSGLLQNASRVTPTTSSSTTIDGPSYHYFGYITNATTASSQVLLKKEDGASATLTSNQSSEAALLVNVLDSLCPRAFEL